VLAGIDLGGTQARVAVARSDGRILAARRVHTAELGGPGAFVEWAADALERLRGTERIRTLAIGSPGPIDLRRGLLVNPPNLHGWRNVPLRDMLAELTGAKVLLENDANLAGLGEFHQGAGRGSRNLAYVTWSTGVGSGLIVDGRLYQGSHGTAGELGHTILDPDGPLCTCGQRGCLEQLAAGHGIAAQAGKPALEVFADAGRGDPQARLVVRRAAVYMGLGLINVTNFLDPDLIVIGGGIVQSWALVAGVLRDTLASSPFIKPARRPKLRRARLGDRAGLTGAVEWARANR
jgi:glucokinase